MHGKTNPMSSGLWMHLRLHVAGLFGWTNACEAENAFRARFRMRYKPHETALVTFGDSIVTTVWDLKTGERVRREEKNKK